jgi:hypothetical protein
MDYKEHPNYKKLSDERKNILDDYKQESPELEKELELRKKTCLRAFCYKINSKNDPIKFQNELSSAYEKAKSETKRILDKLNVFSEKKLYFLESLYLFPDLEDTSLFVLLLEDHLEKKK